ncbi:MAG: NAD(P)H-hydrate dehydratase [Elusimicrobia bacterium]|nr:NAD(P)H-hydrate dehydratase [Elusimicrobiota bacterium]
MTKKITPEFLKKLVKKRPSDCHKGNFGRVLIIAGSKGMTGAAVLSAKACLKAGAGLVTAACPESQQPIIAASLPEAMTLPVIEKHGSIALKAVNKIISWNKAKNYELCLVGPGLSVNSETPDFVIEIIRKLRLPAVIDADALNSLALRGNAKKLPKDTPFIFTPHPGEAKRLVKKFSGSKIDLARRISKTFNAVVVLKGHGTVVTDSKEIFINPTGGPCLAKGGSGDILAGIIAGLWAQAGVSNGFSLKTAFESACLGVYLHGLCGDLAARKFTERCVLAGELLDFLPSAYRKTNSQI